MFDRLVGDVEVTVLVALWLALSQTDLIGSGDVMSRSYGNWIVDCPQNSLDSKGRVQCSAITTVVDIDVTARRTGDDIEVTLRSSKCPDQIGTAKLNRAAFERPDIKPTLGVSASDMFVASIFGFGRFTCGIVADGKAVDRKSMSDALKEVASRRQPMRPKP